MAASAAVSDDQVRTLRLSRLVQWESQATALTYQGPQDSETAGLGTAAGESAREVATRQQYLMIKSERFDYRARS
jgi:hypothetical protein